MWDAAYFRFLRARINIRQLDIPETVIIQRKADEYVLRIGQVIAQQRLVMVENNGLQPVPAVCNGTAYRIQDAAEEHHLAVIYEFLQVKIQHVAIQIGDATLQMPHPAYFRIDRSFRLGGKKLLQRRRIDHVMPVTIA
ncbi:hypothetical protein GALL_484340 [mine drainage metagenome]|uniref:Uncharacterized protein n=1 Tax=mine drainage metagenome TaxID=410659 RepID=A0A1J5PEZ9_9ZZZZ